jgi:hypothetical protein
MKKLFSKLALFTFVSIILAIPLQAFAAAPCIKDTEKNKFLITIIEEGFGEPNETGAEYKSRTCCRTTTVVDGIYSSPELNLTCEAPCTLVTNPENKKVNGKICEEVMVILSKGGTTMIEGYIASIYTWAASLVGLIAVTVIIISGIQIAMSGGDPQALDSGKNRIIKSISGLAVLFLSGLILYTINPNFFTTK